MTYMDISWIGCGLSKEPSILFLEITMRRIADVTEALSGVRIGKDTVSRLVERQEKRKAWRKRPLEGASVINLTLLARAGVDEECLRKVWQWR
jgi:putative transposase